MSYTISKDPARYLKTKRQGPVLRPLRMQSDQGLADVVKEFVKTEKKEERSPEEKKDVFGPPDTVKPATDQPRGDTGGAPRQPGLKPKS